MPSLFLIHSLNKCDDQDHRINISLTPLFCTLSLSLSHLLAPPPLLLSLPCPPPPLPPHTHTKSSSTGVREVPAAEAQIRVRGDDLEGPGDMLSSNGSGHSIHLNLGQHDLIASGAHDVKGCRDGAALRQWY